MRLEVLAVPLVWFLRHSFQAGRLWLAWLICGLRVVTLVLTFSLNPNLKFREISGARGSLLEARRRETE